jgi:chromosome segregation ATPase
MSKVNLESAKNNIDKILTSLNELQQLLSSKTEEVNTKIRDLNENLASFFNKAENLSQQINMEEEKKSNKNAQMEELNKKIQELTHSKDILSSEIASNQRDIEQLSAVILEKEKNFTEISVQVDSLNGRIENLNQKNEEIDVLTQTTLEETKDELRRKEIQHAEIASEYSKMISRSKALMYLIKRDIVNLPEIQVIRSLTVPGVNNEENLKKTSGVSDQIIRNILTDLDRREIIAFDTHTGKFELLTKIDI